MLFYFLYNVLLFEVMGVIHPQSMYDRRIQGSYDYNHAKCVHIKVSEGKYGYNRSYLI